MMADQPVRTRVRSGRICGLGAMVLVLLISLWCPDAVSVSVAQESRSADGFDWKATNDGREFAASLGVASFNFFDVGDLSSHSLHSVERDLRRLAAAAGVKLDHTSGTKASVAIVHDTKVFERLKNDKSSFKILGFSEYLVSKLEEQVTSDTPKCLAMTFADERAEITSTIILLSERADNCLSSGLLGSFGIVGTSDISTKTLTDVCVLYEGRRLGLRDRQSLKQAAPRLRNLCLAKTEEIE